VVAIASVLRLLVNIAERSCKRTGSILDSNVREPDVITKSHNIVQRRIPRRWLVLKRQSASNGVASVLQVLVLPCPPDTINLRMMVPKVGVGRRVID
jgi:hypothetical protein